MTDPTIVEHPIRDAVEHAANDVVTWAEHSALMARVIELEKLVADGVAHAEHIVRQ